MRLDLYTGERERFLNFDFDLEDYAGSTVVYFVSCDPTVNTVYRIIQPVLTYTFNKVYKLNINGNISPYCWQAVGEGYYPNAITNAQIAQASEGYYNTCSSCSQYKYKLVNCINSDVIYTDYQECPDCINYINQLAYTYLEPNPCWYVTVVPETVGDLTTVIIDGDAYCDQCEPICYTVTGTGVITYFDGYSEFTTTDAPAVICSSSYPSVTGTDYQIFTNNLFCDGDIPCYYTYELTNCVTGVKIQSEDQELAFVGQLFSLFIIELKN
jgi:hypothetical protein